MQSQAILKKELFGKRGHLYGGGSLLIEQQNVEKKMINKSSKAR